MNQYLRIGISRARVKLRRERSEARSGRREADGRGEHRVKEAEEDEEEEKKKEKKKKGANRIERVWLQAKVKRGEKHASATLPVHTPGASWLARGRPFYHWAHNPKCPIINKL